MLSRLFLTINTLIMGMMFLFPTISFSSDSSTDTGEADTLLQFLETEHIPLFSLLPPSLPIAESFKPSATSYAGTLVQLEGTAYIYHKNGTSAYKARKDLPVFNGDTLVTAKNSKVTLQMSDNSTLILTAQTKLLIDSSLPRIKARDTVLQLFFGRVRALVKRLAGEYTIRTANASIGVRGTDFAVAVAPDPKKRTLSGKEKISTGFLTAVLTGGHHSTVKLAGLSGPPVMVRPFSASGVFSGNRAEQAVYIGPAVVSLLERIAPQQQQEVLPPSEKFPLKPSLKFSQRSSQSVNIDPCWTLFVKILGTEKKKYFKVCKPTQEPVQKTTQKIIQKPIQKPTLKPIIILLPEAPLLPTWIKGLPEGFTYKNQKDQGADQDSKGR
ncbi:MAG: hypothetical protein D3903_03740 [Candidatus Electrothrix sp. GM3_4]|nr:hypothetical protein [Candidatus Electrothrix sp. GM3_4]